MVDNTSISNSGTAHTCDPGYQVHAIEDSSGYVCIPVPPPAPPAAPEQQTVRIHKALTYF